MTLADITTDPASWEGKLPTRPVDPWLARRRLGWGASDLPVLFAARGWLDAGAITADQRAEIENNRHGVPRYLARKAGLMKDKRGQSQAQIEAQEKTLLRVWLSQAEDHGVDPDSVRHASEAPREWYPLIDRHCPALSTTPDAWGRDIYDGSLVTIELKCPPDVEAWSRWGMRWTVQVTGQLAVTGADRGLLVCGERWAIPGADGRVTTNAIERDEPRILRCREAAADAMKMVEDLRRVKR